LKDVKRDKRRDREKSEREQRRKKEEELDGDELIDCYAEHVQNAPLATLL
jgi:hypothetical protein